jgi:hypothetical protein
MYDAYGRLGSIPGITVTGERGIGYRPFVQIGQETNSFQQDLLLGLCSRRSSCRPTHGIPKPFQTPVYFQARGDYVVDLETFDPRTTRHDDAIRQAKKTWVLVTG